MELPIYLIGYMGAGKTTIGRLLAQKLGWAFVDLDDAFAEMHGLTPQEYINLHGVEEFRKKEKYCVEDLSELPIQKVIYATGGGYPCWEDNMDCLLELGTTFYLRWSAHDLAKRLELTDLSTRPLLKEATISSSPTALEDFIAWQMSAREDYYSRAHYTIECPPNNTLSEQNDEQIAQALYNFIQANK